MWLIIGKVSKNYIKSALFVSLSFVLFFFYGHIYNVLSDFFNEYNIFLSTQITLSIFAIFFVSITIYLIRSKRKFDNLTKIANVVSITMIIISSFGMIEYFLNQDQLTSFDSEEIFSTNTDINNQNNPDVYYIILDAYPNYFTLIDYFGFENNEFIEFLEDNEFYVASKSKTAYPTTIESIPSFLNMNYIHYEFQNFTAPASTSLYYKMAEQNKLMKNFKSKGYEIINFNSGWMPTRFLPIADLNMCSAISLFNSELTTIILDTSMLKPVYAKFFEQNSRGRVLCPFEQIPELSNKYEKPLFVFAHIVSPHPPILFGPNGEYVSSKSLDLGTTEYTNEEFVNQLKFINKKTMELVDKILEDNKDSIIVIQADHGFGGNLDWNNPTSDVWKNRYGILNAYHVSNKTQELLYDDISPVNSFRIILNSYFNDNYELLEDRSFFTKGGVRSSNYIDITDIITR